MINLFLHAALLTTTPILLAATGGFVNRMGGLVNLGLESMMLAGALVAVEISAATGSALLATLAASAVGAIVAFLMSLVVTRLRANEIIVGLNPRFSRAVGIELPRVVLGAMIASGVVGGLAGGIHTLGLVHRFVAGFCRVTASPALRSLCSRAIRRSASS